MDIQVLPLANLVPYARNAKTHPKEQIDKIAHQISTVGFLVPIVTDKDLVVIAGHGRLLAAKALGMEMVPVFVAHHLTEEQAMAWRIADNKVSESPWDMQLLAFDLKTLESHGMDLQLTGFSMPDAQEIMKSLTTPDTKPVAEEAAEAAKTTNKEPTICPHCGGEF